MDGTPENDASVAFVNQDLDEVVAKIVDVIREVRPQVLVTYNENGGYGHPDHIRAHDAAMRAAQICDVPKVYFMAFPKSLMRAGRELAASIGMSPDDWFSDDEIELIGTDDAEITTVIDCTAFVRHKFRALEAHRTQLGTTQIFLQIPEEFRAGMGHEHYVLARSSASGGDGTETDLFAGVDA